MLYPLKFHPILKEKIWGGTKLKTILNKPCVSGTTGESWEISTVPDNISRVSNGVHQGITLKELITKYKGDLVGKNVYPSFGDTFPLLIKYIDATQDLSVQLHPGDTLAKKRHNSFGKTEMWYVVQADPGTQLIVDFKKKTDKEAYQVYLENNKLVDLLNFETISKGDSYMIKAGTIHAIGKGALIAEIQQTSDITYRVYDWDRTDDDGNARALHTEQAIDALNFETNNNCKLSFEKNSNAVNEVASIPYFTTNFINVVSSFERNYEEIPSFIILMCVEGNGTLTFDGGTETITLGDTVLIPSVIEKIFLEEDSGGMKLLEVYIK
ncbi:class I mannose-6-phosphate isomerase [Aquimarina sp. U1-2]|uniref:type I phosphomannose isomerase catalytic subunit n=1 Tax=Aquimarina sp. U1-2 TaxID=2823141 RepID=UPI001AECACC5|nr:type I phosphomannose isomerase catalytic subunit [Aquimarina sp. U1-2]MBP2833868.1 class I mannose-6-phosphate isomerase [Aquimarina sp. U1-2]